MKELELEQQMVDGQLHDHQLIKINLLEEFIGKKLFELFKLTSGGATSPPFERSAI